MINPQTLTASVSGRKLYYYDPAANSDKFYQGHLTQVDGQWIAWVTFGRRTATSPQRSLVTKAPMSLDAAMTMLTKRIISKERKGYEAVDYGSGCISHHDVRVAMERAA